MASSMSELMGTRSQGTFDSSGDSYGTPQSGHRELSNVQQNPGEPNLMPAYKGNLGQRAAMFGNFRNALPGQGTFFPQDAEPMEMPRDKASDSMQNWAKGF
jgi:hypothetical protein